MKKEKLNQVFEKMPETWLWFTYVLIILGALAVVISFFVSFYLLVDGDDEGFKLFLYSLVGFVGLLIPCAIIQLLVKIEHNTKNNNKNN